MKFNIENYKGNYCMHCKTEKEAKDFCNYLHSVGRKWKEGESYQDVTYFEDCESDIFYFFNEGQYDDNCDFAKDEGYTVLEWENFDNKIDFLQFFTEYYKRSPNDQKRHLADIIMEYLQFYCNYCPLKDQCYSEENRKLCCYEVLEKYLNF